MDTKKTYSHDFQVLTVQLIKNGGTDVARIAKDLDIEPRTIYRWIREISQKPEETYPGEGRLTSDAEIIRQLKREKEQLRAELEALKAATVAKDQS